MLNGRIDTDDAVVVAVECGGGEDLEPPPRGLDDIYPVESAGKGPDGTAGGIWSKMAAVLNSGCINCNKSICYSIILLS